MDPFASATELLADLRAGKVTSRDLTDLYIRRIETYDTTSRSRCPTTIAASMKRSRHPSETEDYLVPHVLACCLEMGRAQGTRYHPA